MIEENDLEDILAQVLIEVKEECGRVILAEVCRRSGVSEAIVKRWRDNGFHVLPYKKPGRPKGDSKLAPYQDQLLQYLTKGITNSEVIYNLLIQNGYKGGKTIIKDYVRSHRQLVPAKRKLVAPPKSSTGQRYYTAPGDCYQMDWGFMNVEDCYSHTWRCACFAMVCHHCGFRYIEFFPNAKQEQLFIGMTHAFLVMGLPRRVLTDNMKSVVIRRDAIGQPIWNKEYDNFQRTIGFKTDLCKVEHPFTKGKVERLVQYVKQNFVIGRTFINITDLNKQAWAWCIDVNSKPMKEYDFITIEEHREKDMLHPLKKSDMLIPFLAPVRSVSFDGFIEYEGRKYGLPYYYQKRKARVLRLGDVLHVLDVDTFAEIQVHPVDWAKKAKIASHQWSEYLEQPEEQPTAPVKSTMYMEQPLRKGSGRFDRFRIEEAKR